MADYHRNQPVPAPRQGFNNLEGSPSTAIGGIQDGVLFKSTSQGVGAVNSDEFVSPNWKGVRLYIDVTVVGAGPGTVTVKIQGFDPTSLKWFDVTGATTAALNAIESKTLTVYPGITAAAGSATTSTEVSNFLPNRWRIVATVAVNAVTFSIGGEYLL